METISKLVEVERKKIWMSDKARDAHVDLKPEGIEQRRNMIYNRHHQKLDVYYPKNKPIHRVLVNIHGGGFFYGDKEIYKAYCLCLAKNGFAVINFNYRLAPEHCFPAALDDVNDLFWWLASYIKEEKVGVIADSAGAQLALQYMTLQTNHHYRSSFSYKKIPYVIDKVALYCGIYFLEQSFTMTQGRLKELRKAYLPDHIWKKYRQRLQVEQYITDALPSLFIATGQDDFLKEDTLRLHDYLKEKSISHYMKEYCSQKEAVRHVFELQPATSISDEAMKDLMYFFNQ